MNKIKDLEILKEYLSEEELKEIAKSAAYDLFKNNLAVGEDAYYRKENLSYYATKGAMMAMEEFYKPFISELTSGYKDRIIAAIKKIDHYDVTLHNARYKELFNQAIEQHKSLIESKTTEIITKYVNDETQFGNFYDKMIDIIGTSFSDMLYSLLESNFKKDETTRTN